jgi:hypothetical protein
MTHVLASMADHALSTRGERLGAWLRLANWCGVDVQVGEMPLPTSSRLGSRA